MSQLRKYMVRVPAEKKEQTAISGLLNDMDTEIDVLEQILL